MIGGVLSLLLTLTGAFETAFAMVAFFSVVPYAMTDAALFVLRRREPNLERPFRTPLYPWLPLLVLLVDTAVVVAFFVADVRGSLLSAGLVALAIPVLLVLRRARRLGPAAGA
jgi:APA family basic amino acid/polyamine antiporter